MMGITAEQLAAHLGGRQSGTGWSCRCPAHEDRRASLSVSEGDDGKLLAHCMAGCSFDAVLGAANLTHGSGPNLDHGIGVKHASHSKTSPMGNTRKRKEHPTAEAAIRAAEWGQQQSEPAAKLVEVYHYSEAVKVARFTGKQFAPVHRLDSGRWVVGKPDRYPIYNADDLADVGDSFVYFTEGEKDADRLKAEGLIGITIAGGAEAIPKNLRDADLAPLAGRHVVLLPDNDDSGRKCMDAVASILADVAASVRIVELPGLPSKGDVSDWFDAGGDPEDLWRLAEGASICNPMTDTATGPKDQLDGSLVDSTSDTRTAAGLIFRTADTIDTRPIDWFWEQRIPSGSIGLIMGMPNQGKSVLTMDIAARVTKGMPWPVGEKTDMPCGSVAVLAVEDSPEQVIVPRLRAAGADLSKILIVDGVSRIDGDPDDQAKAIAVRDSFDIARDIDKLKKVGEQVGDLKLVIIDPMDSFIGGKVDIFRGNEARQALWPLKDWAEQSGVTVLICHHLNKSPSGNVLDRVSGARSFGALPRSVWMIAADESYTEGNRSILAPAKWNMSRRRPPATSYDIKPSLGDPDTPCVAWLADEIDMSAGELMARQASADNGDPSAVDEASAFLLEVLSDGPRPTAEVRKLAREASVSWSTVKRAKTALGVKSEQVREDHKVSGWVMTLGDHLGDQHSRTQEP